MNYNALSQEMLLLLMIMTFSSLVYIGFFNSVLIIYRWLILIPIVIFAMSPVNSTITTNLNKNKTEETTTNI